MKGSKSFDSTRPRRQAGSSGSLHPGPLPQGHPFSASHRPGVGTDAAVSQSRQRSECGDLSPLSSASASQLAADSPVPRAKAPTSWRTPNAAATAKPALSLHTCRVRNALNTDGRGPSAVRGQYRDAPQVIYAGQPASLRFEHPLNCLTIRWDYCGSMAKEFIRIGGAREHNLKNL